MNHLSYSQISMKLKCGESWRRRYIEGDIIPPGIALIKGSSGHVGIEANNVQKIVSHEDLPKKDIVDISVAEFEERTTNEEILLSDDEKTKGKDKVIGEAKDSLVKVSGLYADKAAPTIQPIAAEKKIVIDVEGTEVVTIIDCIDDKNGIHDFKFTGKTKTQSEADTSLQLSLYALSYFQEYGGHEVNLSFDCLVDKKVPEYSKISTVRRSDEILKVAFIVEEVKRSIERGVFLPAPEGVWWCSPRFCGYWNTCKYVGNKIF